MRVRQTNLAPSWFLTVPRLQDDLSFLEDTQKNTVSFSIALYAALKFGWVGRNAELSFILCVASKPNSDGLQPRSDGLQPKSVVQFFCKLPD